MYISLHSREIVKSLVEEGRGGGREEGRERGEGKEGGGGCHLQ